MGNKIQAGKFHMVLCFILGIGYSLMYLPSIAAVSFYFTKYRAFATGVAVCGTGLGTFTFALLSSVLVVTYGWQGAMLIIAGIALNGLVCSATYFPINRIATTRTLPETLDLLDKTNTDIIEVKDISDKNPYPGDNGSVSLMKDNDNNNRKLSKARSDEAVEHGPKRDIVKPYVGLHLLKNPALWLYSIGVFAMFTGK